MSARDASIVRNHPHAWNSEPRDYRCFMHKLRSWIGIFVLVAAVYTAFKVLPCYMANYELEKTIDTAARFGAIDHDRSEQDLRERVLLEAKTLHIDLQPEQVFVQRTQDDVLIWSEYTVHVDLPGYPLDLQFQPMSKSKRRRM